MNIEINHSSLGKTKKEIENYINVITSNMKLSTNEVYSLTRKNWKNMDSLTFKSKWQEQNDQSSVTEHMKAALRSYASSLAYAETQYKDAQSKAIWRSSILW